MAVFAKPNSTDSVENCTEKRIIIEGIAKTLISASFNAERACYLQIQMFNYLYIYLFEYYLSLFIYHIDRFIGIK